MNSKRQVLNCVLFDYLLVATHICKSSLPIKPMWTIVKTKFLAMNSQERVTEGLGISVNYGKYLSKSLSLIPLAPPSYN